MNRNEIINEIVKAARRPMLEVVKRYDMRYKAGHPKAGKLCYGLQFGETADMVERASEYFVQMERSGTTVGKRYATASELIADATAWRDRDDASFREELKKMDDDQIARQAKYWLKDKAA